MSKLTIGLSSVLALSACVVVGPDYSRKDIALPAEFHGGTAVSHATVTSEHWWTLFKDATLSRLIWHGVADNLSLKTAIERLAEASAATERTGLRSQVTGGLDARLERDNVNDTTRTFDSASANISFLVDVFGAVKRRREQALALEEAQELEVGAARLAVLSQITETYIQTRFFQAAAQSTRATIRSRERLVDVVQRRREVGVATELEAEQARSLLLSAKASLPSLLAGFEGTVFRLATLLASPSDPVGVLVQGGGPQPYPTGSATIGIPADLLRNRPDIRRAEQDLVAATAAIGVAEAALYPSLRLNGVVLAGDLDGWNFGARINLPIFNQSVLRADRKIAISRARQAELVWRENVLRAVEEVQAAQSRCRYLSAEVRSLRGTLASAEKVLALSNEGYKLGSATLLDVLNAEIAVDIARIDIAAAKRDLALAWTALQVAAGKGWTAEPPTTSGDDVSGL